MTRDSDARSSGTGSSRRSMLKYGAETANRTVGPSGPAGNATTVEIGEQAMLAPADGTADAGFGSAIAVDQTGSTVLVGAPDESPSRGDDAGAAYVFTRHGDGYAQTAKLTLDGGQAGDRFGVAVTLDATGETALVGQQPADGDGTAGAYVFERRRSQWVQTATLTPPDPEGLRVGDFGEAVALDAAGRTAAIGAPGSDDPAFDAGVVFVTERDGDSWTDLRTLRQPYGDSARYGSAVDLAASGTAGAVGAPVHRPANDPLRGGFVHVLRRTGEEWRQPSLHQADDAADVDRLGTTVACDASCRTIVAGQTGDDAGETRDCGGAVVFRRTPRGWDQTATLADSGGRQDRFGAAAALDDNGQVALVGAPGRATEAGDDAGAAVLYARDGGTWSREAAVVPSDAAPAARFGAAVALDASGRTTVVGAPAAGDGATGATYVFTRS